MLPLEHSLVHHHTQKHLPARGNGGLRIFYSKCFWAWLKFFRFTFQTTWVVFSSGHFRHCAEG
jgi:hypothetical protein